MYDRRARTIVGLIPLNREASLEVRRHYRQLGVMETSGIPTSVGWR